VVGGDRTLAGPPGPKAGARLRGRAQGEPQGPGPGGAVNPCGRLRATVPPHSGLLGTAAGPLQAIVRGYSGAQSTAWVDRGMGTIAPAASLDGGLGL
jgi:hypothetical protein